VNGHSRYQPSAIGYQSAARPHLSAQDARPQAPSSAQEGLLFLPSADFWRQEAPQVEAARYLAFDVGSATYAVPLGHVREVDRVPAITRLPNVADWLLGAANLRGEILSVVDFASFLGLGSTRISRESRLLACRAGSMEAGILVDRIRDIRQLPDAAIRPPTGLVTGRAGRYLAGVYPGDGRLTMILDVRHLLYSPELRRFE
jgi:purine-binding chemotaxis protein CheW